MAVLPNSREEMIEWFANRIAQWSANAATIGLDMAQITEVASLIDAAVVVHDDAIAARQASKDATIAYYNGADALRAYGADLIKVIKATAESTDNPDIYSLASIPPPADPTPAGAPDQPTDLTATVLLPFGIGLSWKGSTSQGAYFEVYRRLETESTFSILKTTKEKSFEDRTIPDGVDSVQYYIAAARDEFRTNSSSLAVQFGAGGSTTIALAA